jgi:hypothetical protein
VSGSPARAAVDRWDERDALARLRYAHGPLERRAALLALLLEPGNEPERRAWEAECAGLAGAARWRDDVGRLGEAARLPVFEALLERCCTAPEVERAGLVEAARRVIGADDRVRPLDLLRWLVLRQRLLEAPPGPAGMRPAAPTPPGTPSPRAAFEVLTGFLMRVVPQPPEAARPGPAQQAWRERALEAVAGEGDAASAPDGPEGDPAPDGEGVLRALRALQAESWMRRPRWLRAWIDALPPPGPAALGAVAAEALCLCATLLDVPRPASLAARYAVAPLG